MPLARVLVAMSGGVDSSVAAGLLREAGHEVIGATMQVWPEAQGERTGRHGGCCGFGAAADARAVAARLGIPHYVFNMREAFHRQVVRSFADAYARGRTPNPCIACNQHIKFDALWDKADTLGADFLATGHYARIGGPAGDLRLRRALHPGKDQSYVLYPLRRALLPRLLFPLGEQSKAETRAQARRLGLAVADKPDSVDICFVDERGYEAIVAGERPEAFVPGPIVDLEGNVLGQHRGLPAYTVGQRRGLGLTGAAPRYVVALQPERNTLVVGGASDVFAEGCSALEANWLVPEPPDPERTVAARVRSGGGEAPARVRAHDKGRLEVDFLRPARAVTPGQAVVLYDGDDVLGGAVIDRVRRAVAAGRG